MSPSSTTRATIADNNPAAQPALRPDYPPEKLKEWLDRHKQLCIRARKGGVDVLFLGDSITEAWEKQGLPAWQRIARRYRIANFGQSGDRTQQLLWRIAHGELDSISPAVTVVQIGTNNLDPGLDNESLLRQHSPEETVAGIAAVMREIQLRIPHSRILLTGIFPRGEKGSRYRVEVPAINAGLRQLAPSLGVQFLEFTSKFLPSSGELDPVLFPDKLHLSSQGYEMWADALLPELERLIPIGH